MFGVVPVSAITGDGLVWLIGTDDIEAHTRAFLMASRAEVALLLEAYSRLFNLIDADNTVSIRWLKWLGFSFFPAIPLNGWPFLPFEVKRV